jgi:hypothetical protein
MSADTIDNHYRFTFDPYYKAASEAAANLHKDIFLISPESLYLAYKQNIKVIKKNNIILDLNTEKSKRGIGKYKAAFYESFGYPLIVPFCKQTGFESLKQHLATESGNYDEFDRRYRHPLLNNIGPPGVAKFKNYHLLEEIYAEIDEMILTDNPTICNTFKFDW